MIAAYLEKPNAIALVETDLPEPNYEEIRVKLNKIGICGSDVHLFLGHRLLDKPTIIGHEGLGTIDKIGEGVTNRSLGERIVIEPNFPCRKCEQCLTGRGNICSNKRILGMTEAGCFAEYICIPSEFGWKVPNSISDDNAVTIEPMAVAVHALSQSKTQPGDTIAVIGLGAIGLLITHLALALGYKVFVSEINSQKIDLAKSMGAIGLDSDKIEIIQTLESNNVAAIFECAGAAQTASLATEIAPRGSKIVLVGLSANLATFTPLKIAREGISIIPSIIYHHPIDFRRTIQLIESKVINPGFIISSTAKLNNIAKALQLAAEGNESKIIIEIK